MSKPSPVPEAEHTSPLEETSAVQPSHPEEKSIGGLIRHFRERADISQKEFSKRVGHASAEWTGMIESGARKLDIDLVPRVAQILKVNLRDLTLVALAQYYPKTYSVLFGQQEPGMPQEQATPVTLQPETYDMAMIFEALPPRERGMILEITKALSKNNRSTMHVKRVRKDTVDDVEDRASVE
jgi:transcriptional regulator with XRE-family HTH domain